MPRTVTTVVPSPDDPTNGIVDGVSLTITKQVGGAVTCRVDYPADPAGTDEFPISALVAADRLKVRDAALAILGVYKTRRSYT